MAEKLEPCPFCGSRDRVYLASTGDEDNGDGFSVNCLSCDAWGPFTKHKTKARRLWNYRPGELDLHQHLASIELANIGNEFIENVDDGENP